jgi:hypothetical protein
MRNTKREIRKKTNELQLKAEAGFVSDLPSILLPCINLIAFGMFIF